MTHAMTHTELKSSAIAALAQFPDVLAEEGWTAKEAYAEKITYLDIRYIIRNPLFCLRRN